MSIQEYIKAGTHHLTAANIPTARLDTLVLLEDAMSLDRAILLAEPDMEIPAETQNVLNTQLERRAAHEPLAYIRGKTEFYGREFIVTPAVLEPRPESETIIELLCKRADLPTAPRIADVGTGSGALGITAKLELPDASVDLLDIDEAALEVAQMNVIKFTSGNSVYKTDLLTDSPGNYDVLLCNLPYVPDEHTINTSAMHEPQIAIFGGKDGLDLYRKLFEQLKIVRNRPLLILCESLPPQHAALRMLAEKYGYAQDIEDDFIQVFKRSA